MNNLHRNAANKFRQMSPEEKKRDVKDIFESLGEDEFQITELDRTMMDEIKEIRQTDFKNEPFDAFHRLVRCVFSSDFQRQLATQIHLLCCIFLYFFFPQIHQLAENVYSVRHGSCSHCFLWQLRLVPWAVRKQIQSHGGSQSIHWIIMCRSFSTLFICSLSCFVLH